MAELIHGEETYRILGACFKVYNTMGCGFLEPVYQECLAIEFEHQQIGFERERSLTLEYRGTKLVQTYKVDFVCCDKVLVEVKAVSALRDEHRAQVLNYLHASGLKLGLLVNFGHYPDLEHQRLIV